MNYYVYILSNHSKTVLYTGVTNDLEKRIYQHKHVKLEKPSFVQRYHCYKLVYFDHGSCVKSAIEREKQIKGWARAKKEALINESNPEWKDLSAEWNR